MRTACGSRALRDSPRGSMLAAQLARYPRATSELSQPSRRIRRRPSALSQRHWPVPQSRASRTASEMRSLWRGPSIAEPGVVHFDAPGETWLGPFEPSPATAAEVAQLAALISTGGLPTHALADSRGAQWTKLIFNAANNSLCAASGLSIGQLGDLPAMMSLVSSVIAEGRAVAAALGIVLESDPQAMFDDAVAHAYGHRPSMLQDVAARRPTEIAVLNGGIVAEGRRVGVPTPSNEALVAIIEGIELSWTS
jgi:2-dehydropantoate 2-reductase